jgi:hypothetical protein
MLIELKTDQALEFIVGIDPGKTGGIVGIHKQTGNIGFMDKMPLIGGKEFDVNEFLLMLQKRRKIVHVVLEKAQAYRGQGIVSAFNYARDYGIIIGILTALRVPYTLVVPQTWQKEIFIGTVNKIHPKVRAAQAAQRLFPQVNFLATDRSKKPHEGFIDAALIAEWGRRKL